MSGVLWLLAGLLVLWVVAWMAWHDGYGAGYDQGEMDSYHRLVKR